MKKILILSAALLFTACTTASKPGAMMVPVSDKTIISDSSKLSKAVSIAAVDGGKKTNPLWTSEVSNEDFTEALRQSLAAHAMLADGDGDYVLTANLNKLKQPIAGLNMSVTSNVTYTLKKISTGEIVMEETIEEKYTAKMGDAFMGNKRLQLANEGSIKANISNLIEKMIESVDGDSISVASIDVVLVKS